MKLTVPAHKHVGDAGKPGQIVHPVSAEDVRKGQAQIGHMLRDLMYQHGISPFHPAQKQARTLKDTL